MKPLDPKLLKHAKPARKYVIFAGLCGLLVAGCLILQAYAIAALLSGLISGDKTLPELGTPLLYLAFAIVGRALISTVESRFSEHSANLVITELRAKTLRHIAFLGPRWGDASQSAANTTLLTRGINDLGPYFTKYLPQLFLSLTVTPLVLLVVGLADWVSGLIIIFTLPLVPIFMILVGQLTQNYSVKKLDTLEKLGDQVLDLVAGIATLRTFNRHLEPVKQVRDLGERYRKSTMDTLRVAFLSGMVLELLTTLSVAVVAVGVGLRLVHGNIDFDTALLVLVLAPEVYLPLRQVGTHFHASTDGITAAQKVFEILDTPLPNTATSPGGRVTLSDCPQRIVFENLSVSGRQSGSFAPFQLNGEIRGGEITALDGLNGSGKTTTVLTMLGLVAPASGKISFFTGERCIESSDLDFSSFWNFVSWVPQRVFLPSGSLYEVITGGQKVSTADLNQALSFSGLTDLLEQLPNGLGTVIGTGGFGLSLGQRRRVALAQALLTERPIVILDEPSAHLDAISDEILGRSIAHLKTQGKTVILIAHRSSLRALADRVITITSGVQEAPTTVAGGKHV